MLVATPWAAKAGTANETTVLEADQVVGRRLGETIASGNVRIKRGTLRMRADEIRFDELADTVSAQDGVEVDSGGGLTVSGPRAEMTLYSATGKVESPRYCYAPPAQPAHTVPLVRSFSDDSRPQFSGEGGAQALFFEGENRYRLAQGTWSSCHGPDPDWYIQANDLQLDLDRNTGVARNSWLVFKGARVLWWPWAEFPLTSDRQSGFLAPSLSLSSSKGLDLSLPYYWNIAPNYDATLTPRLLTKRGLMLGGEYRYLTENYGSGTFRGEWLPEDRQYSGSRALGSWQHQQTLLPGLTANIDFNAVSDEAYFDDISTQIETTALTHLSRKATLAYSGGWWSAALVAQSWQTLGAENYASAPYEQLPQFTLNAARTLPGGLQFTFDSEWTAFDLQRRYDSRARGDRLYAYPQLSWRYERPEGFLQPKVGLNFTRYHLDHQPLTDGRDSITRTLPVLSLDGGLYFDRNAHLFGRTMRQTLEPRLYYVYAPYRRQDDIPVFDTARYDFSMAQLFTENRYSGKDRFADANQLTLALTSRLIEERSGVERLQLMLGQRYYFADRKVLLPGEAQTQSNRSDLLAQVRGEIGHNVSINTALQYNLDDRRSERYKFGVRYLPAPGKSLSAGYRFANSTDLREVDVAGQWPIRQNWLLVGRVSRSITDGRITDAIGGIEYNAGCWRLRTAVHHFTTSDDKLNNTFFLQLELNGLGALGTNPTNLLRRSVPGYGQISDNIGTAP